MQSQFSKFIVFCAFSFFSSAYLQAQISFNEYSASNLNQFNDAYNKFEDWVELYNASDVPVDISGWHLSDRENKPYKWKFPQGTTIGANDFAVFYCSGRDTLDHTNFKLSQTKGNEFLILSKPDETIVESFPLALTLLGHSNAKNIDGDGSWMICTDPSFIKSNTNSFFFERYTAAPTINMEAGFYDGTIEVSATNHEPNSVLHYTLDGTLPTLSSPVYDSTLVIDTTTVVKLRAYSMESNILPGKIAFKTFFIDESFTLPVISVGADELFDLAAGNPTLRPIGSIEYFDPAKSVYDKSYGELNKHGQDSWALDQRSLDYVCRDEMGYSKAIQTALFNYSERDEHQRLMLRASGDDNYPSGDFDGIGCHMRDEYSHELALKGNMDLDVRAVERIIVFLNGVYWGVYGLRERPVDHDYTKYNYDQDKYHIQYLATWGGTWAEYGGNLAFDDWEIMRNLVLDNDMSDPILYQVFKDHVNVLSMMDYFILNLNVVAKDWLIFNTAWWRGLNPEGGRKKWAYVLWDNDATLGYYINYTDIPNITYTATPCDLEAFGGWETFGSHRPMMLKLINENPEFRQLYFSRYADLMNTVFTCDNMLSTLDSMVNTILPEMPRHVEHWTVSGETVDDWLENIEILRTYVDNRCNFLDTALTICYETEGPYQLTLKVEPENVGEIKLNTLDLTNFPWTGDYYGGMDNNLRAKPHDQSSYEFIRWESVSGNAIFPDEFDPNAKIRLTQNDTLIAHFGVVSDVEEINAQYELEVFPNPTAGQLKLNYLLHSAEDVSIGLYSNLGKHICNFPSAGGMKSPGLHRETLNLQETGISSGLYFLKIRIKDLEISKPIVYNSDRI